MTEAEENQSLEKPRGRRWHRRRNAAGENGEGASARKSLLASYTHEDRKSFVITFAATVTASLAAVIIVGIVGVFYRHIRPTHKAVGVGGSALGGTAATTSDWLVSAGVTAAVLAVLGLGTLVIPRGARQIYGRAILVLTAVCAIIFILLALALGALN